ncbi:LytR C-terminal domain-containing protein [Ruania alba]|uniref:LytR cell envelope-related transcriptional attenuator n=1 Tax=Ruania alba TaxID=648782 RepID=A0A1H5MM75_9MICO|nr:LytR C-terminal domain-containing protein [Ruania alba]SEE90459.1 LytR cell envelope-related transcriptional attenuator [Ruania alba]
MSTPAKARAARRRHLQQRQTVIFGTLITAMLVIGLAAGAVWVGILPSPVSIAISEPESTETGDAGPCPPEAATYVPLNEISANVLNGTSRSGLAASTSAELGDRGISVGRQDNAESPFAGVVRIVSGPEGLAAAYTAGVLFTDARIEVDSRTDETIDVILGSAYEALRSADEVDIDPAVEIPVPQGCEPLSTPESADTSPSAEE